MNLPNDLMAALFKGLQLDLSEAIRNADWDRVNRVMHTAHLWEEYFVEVRS
jgi:hypothetical protein